MQDKFGNTYARLSSLSEGSEVWLDNSFTCCPAGKIKIERRGSSLGFTCDEGFHHLDSRVTENNDDYLVGVFLRDPTNPLSHSPDFFGDITEFHNKFNLQYTGKPRALPLDLLAFRIKFMTEELTEYIECTDFFSYNSPEKNEVDTRICLELSLDALVDLVYVAVGTAYLHGFDFNEAWRRVHSANMKKVRATDAMMSKRNSTHDVVKPPGWLPPSHADLVEDNTYFPKNVPLQQK